MKVGEVSAPVKLGTNWLVYRVESKVVPNPADFEKQKKDLAEQVSTTSADWPMRPSVPAWNSD
jgi:hypothetical protein